MPTNNGVLCAIYLCHLSLLVITLGMAYFIYTRLHISIYVLHIDGHESKPAIFILAIVQESRKTSAFRYFSSYSFYFIT